MYLSCFNAVVLFDVYGARAFCLGCNPWSVGRLTSVKIKSPFKVYFVFIDCIAKAVKNRINATHSQTNTAQHVKQFAAYYQI